MNLLPAGNTTNLIRTDKNAGGFCHDALWDSTLSWYTSRPPDLTQCFKSTVLVYVPALFLALCLPFYCLHYVRHRRRPRGGHYGHGPKPARYMIATTTTNVGSGGSSGGNEPQFLQSKSFMRSPLYVAKIGCYALFIGAAAVQWVYMIFDSSSSAAAIAGGCIEIATLVSINRFRLLPAENLAY